jgi:hypothetical protein
MAKKNKYKAGDYMNSGMSKAQYTAKKGGSSKSSSKSSSKKSSSFNYKALGISSDVWNSLGSSGQSAMAVMGSKVLKIIDKNQPAPEVLDDKQMNELWKQAEADPVIQKYYADEMNVAKDYLNKNIDLASTEFKQLTEDQQRAYIDAKKELANAQAAAGTAYSGFRIQNKGKLDTQQSDIVKSSQATLQDTLNKLGQSFEQRFGTDALGNTPLGQAITAGDIGTYGGENYTGAAYGSETNTPTGNVTGTQASDKLKDELQKQQDLEAEAVQAIQLKNIQKEKKIQDALKKLK